MQATSRGAGNGAAPADDLPRTLRREREARERAGQLGPHSSGPAAGSLGPQAYVPEPTLSENFVVSGNTVTDIKVPFLRLMLFCIKLVFAAIPALLLLGAILWAIGHLLMTFFPWLVKLQILIRVP